MRGIPPFLQDTAASLQSLPFAPPPRELAQGGDLVGGPLVVFAAGVFALAVLVALLILAAVQIRRANHRLGEYAVTLEAKNRELEVAREELALSQKLASVGTLAAGVAHELNNPLTIILGFTTQLLSPRRPLPPSQAEMEKSLSRIRDAALRTKKIVDGFLLFARMKKPEKVPISLNRVLMDGLRSVADQFAAARIRVVTHLAPDLPDISGDPVQLEQVVTNILTNAHHAIRKEQAGGTVTITTATEADRIRLVLENDGPSIPTGHLTRIFDPLFTTKEPGEGTGLGLSICYGIITEHGGTIRAENGPGRGVVFIIDLPVGEGSGRHNGGMYGQPGNRGKLRQKAQTDSSCRG